MVDIKAVYNMLSPEEIETLIRRYIANVFDVETSISMVALTKMKSGDATWSVYHSRNNSYDSEILKTEILATAPYEIKRRVAYINESSLKLITLEKVEYGEQESDDKSTT